MIAFIFPGQGAQKVGMLSAFLNAFKVAKDTVDRIEEAVKIKISDIIEFGPQDELTKTNTAQLSIFTTSMVCLEILKSEYSFDISKQCKLMAGHSLGEISALCASGVFSLEDAAKLVKVRGDAMASVSNGDFLMAALLGVSVNDILPIISDFESVNRFCCVANDNMSTQVVISGYKNAVDKVIEKMHENFPKSKAIPLNTSGPFHTSLMSKAAIELEKYLISGKIKYNDFIVPVISNYSAMAMTDKDEVCGELIKQVISRVRWRETIDILANDLEIEKIVELAPGKVLTSMIKREYPEKTTLNLDTVAEFDTLFKSI